MLWLILVVAVVLVVLTTAAVLGRVDGSLDEATTTLSHEPLPQAPLTPGDLAELHFDTALRGYRMNQVDGVLDRLRREVADLGDEVVRLRRVTDQLPDQQAEQQPPPELAGQPEQPEQPEPPEPPVPPVRERPASIFDRS